MDFFSFLDLLGTMAFAISGALAGREKRLDLFGILTLAFVTAIGGGTLRDVIIGVTPVTWLMDLSYFYTITLGVIVAMVFYKYLEYLRVSLFLFDTIGLAVFVFIGIEKGMGVGLHPIICITLGTITACFGGVIRDILANKIPIIFKREIYATACIIGGAFFYLFYFLGINKDVNYILTFTIIFTIRILAVKRGWKLPFAQAN